MTDEEKWMEKHQDMEGEREKVMDPNMGGSPDTRASPNSLETHLVRKWQCDRGHWTTTSSGPKDIQYKKYPSYYFNWQIYQI